jgi:Domain of unknown function (DUF6457)
VELDEWVAELARSLGVEQEVEVDELLDVARVVAHTVERRAAPVTTYVIGLAVAARGGASALEQVCAEAMALARSRRAGG